MKILVLVQAVTMDRYPEVIKAQQETWDSIDHPDVKVLYYYPNVSGKYGIEGRNISTPGSEHWKYMFINLARTFREIIHLPWDFVVKTDASAYVNKEQLVKVLSDKPKLKYYGGQLYPEKSKIKFSGLTDFNLDFMWGEGFVLSRDLVIHIIDQYALNPTRRLGADDVQLSNIITGKCDWDTTLEIYEYYKHDGPVPINHIYRCKNDEPGAKRFDDEIKALHSIHKQLTQ